jgi:uncharacterized protein (DUF2236 family)
MDAPALLFDLHSRAPEAAAARCATLAGGTAAMFTLLAYPPAAHWLWSEWQRTGLSPDPRPRLINFWVAAVTGSPPEIEVLRRRAGREHPYALFPPEVDGTRFGSGYRASDPTHLAATYTVVCTLVLAAQEKMYRQLSEAEEDAYCAWCAATAGYVYGIGDQAPADYGRLRAAYEAILATRLQGTSFGRAALAAMLAGQIGGPAADVTRRAALLLDERASRRIGLEEAVRPAL